MRACHKEENVTFQGIAETDYWEMLGNFKPGKIWEWRGIFLKGKKTPENRKRNKVSDMKMEILWKII